MTQEVKTKHGVVQVQVFEDDEEVRQTYCQKRGEDCVLVAYVWSAGALIGTIHSHGPHSYVAYSSIAKDYFKVYNEQPDIGLEAPATTMQEAAERVTEMLSKYRKQEREARKQDRANLTTATIDQQLAEILGGAR